MAVKDILLLLHTNQPYRPSLDLAVRLGREHGAFVHCICGVASPEPSLAECFAVGARADRDVIDHLAIAEAKAVAPIETAFLQTIGETGVQGFFQKASEVSGSCEVQSTAIARARTSDLVILAQPQRGDAEGRRRAENLLLHGGTPCMVVPAARAAPLAFDRVVVAWNGSREAKRALSDSLWLLQHALHVDILSVMAAAAKHEPAGPDACLVYLRRHGVLCETRPIPRNGRYAAHAILNFCQETGADLLVMGAFSRSRMAEKTLGGNTHYALTEAPISILMSR